MNVWIVYADLFINLSVFISLSALGMALYGFGGAGSNGGTCEQQEEDLTHFSGWFGQIKTYSKDSSCTGYYSIDGLEMPSGSLAISNSTFAGSRYDRDARSAVCDRILQQSDTESFDSQKWEIMAVGRSSDEFVNHCPPDGTQYHPTDFKDSIEGTVQRFTWKDVVWCGRNDVSNKYKNADRCSKVGPDRKVGTPVNAWASVVDKWLKDSRDRCVRGKVEEIAQSLKTSCLASIADKSRVPLAGSDAADRARTDTGRFDALQKIETRGVFVGDEELSALEREVVKDRGGKIVLKVTTVLQDNVPAQGSVVQ